MKVVVLGAGVIGVTTAYYLAQAGHEVTVIDRQLEPALETSFANAGEISPGYASPWAAPGIPQKAVKWLFMKHAPLILQPKIDLEMIGWLFALLGNCTSKRYAINKSRMGRLANYSRAKLEQLRNDTGIQYDQRMQGTLQLFRKQSDLDKIGKDVDVLQSEGVPYQVLNRKECLAAEPGLAFSKDHIAGGLRLPGDETGDCHKFTVALAARAAMLGVTFRFGVRVQGIQRLGDRIVSVLTDSGEFSADEFVVALGSFTPCHGPQSRPPRAGLSSQGVFDHRTNHQRDACACLDADGRELQDRNHPTWRPDSSGRNGRGVGLRQQSTAPPPCNARPFAGKPVSIGRRHEGGELLVRPQADDPGWHACHRTNTLCQSDSQHRPWHARVDDGVRFGPGRQ